KIEPVLQGVEGLAERAAPLLLPAAAGIAAAIGTPALDAVDAAPRAVFDDLRLPLGRMQLEEFAVVGEFDVAALAELAEDVGQRHVAERVMVAIGLAVGGDVHELGMLAAIIKALTETAE